MENADRNEKEKPPLSDFRNVVTSIFLIVFTLFIGITCVVALASTLTQARISSFAIDGVPLSIWKLDTVREQWAAVRSQQTGQSAELAKSEIQRLDLNARQATMIAKYNAAKTNLIQLIQTLYYRIQNAEPNLASVLDSDVDISEKMARINASYTSLRGKTELGIDELLSTIENTHKAYRQNASDGQALAVEQNSLIEKIETLRKGISSSQESLKAVFGPIKADMDGPTRARIENALYELNPTADFVGRLMNKFVTVQPDVLALSLVLLMGILGSCLQILHSFFRAHRIEAPGSYFLRISVGAITALVIFIVSKAGIPVIADTSKLGGDAPINPYFVSFLAIISGLLSERAIVTVQNQGERFFASGTESPDRWARDDLTPRLQSQSVTTQALADYLHSTESNTASILRGEEKANAEQQRTIAIFLRSTVRDLFTDMPPSGLEHAAKNV